METTNTQIVKKKINLMKQQKVVGCLIFYYTIQDCFIHNYDRTISSAYKETIKEYLDNPEFLMNHTYEFEFNQLNFEIIC